MRAPASPVVPVSDDHIVRLFTTFAVAFSGTLALIGILGVLVLIPDPSVSAEGLVVGVALGLVSWFGSRWITRRAASRATRPGAPRPNVAQAVGPVVFQGIAVAQVPALIGLPLAFAVGSEVGPLLVAVPIAVAAIIINASGPGAVRRHLARLRA